jgi:hypothetical protein
LLNFNFGDSTTVAELQAHDVQRSGERIALAIDMNRVILIDPTSEASHRQWSSALIF